MFTIKHILNWKLEIELNSLVLITLRQIGGLVEDKETFEAFYDLDDDKVLQYTCQLEAPDEVNTLLDKIEQTEFSSDYTRELMSQTAEIWAIDSLEKQDNIYENG